MKKILNTFLICSVLTLSTTPVIAKGWFGKDKNPKEKEKQKVEIVKPDKAKPNIKREIKKTKKTPFIKRIFTGSRGNV